MNDFSIGHVMSLLMSLFQYAGLVLSSPAFAIPVGLLAGMYLLHLAKGLVAPKTLPNSTIFRPSPMAWSVPLIIISALVVKVVSVFR
jgi:hypothetical protein